MSNFEFKLNSAGVRELLKSEAMKSVLREQASRIQQRAGDGYEVEERNYPERAGAVVKAGSAEAYYDNLHNNTLLKAVR